MGVYERTVVDESGTTLRVPVPRLVCRQLGPRKGRVRTFSVLPAGVIPRRRWCLELVLMVALWCQESLSEAADRLSERGLVVEARQVRRLLEVVGIAFERLIQHSLSDLTVAPVPGRRAQAGRLLSALQGWSAAGRGPPESVVMAWQERWGLGWLDIRLS